MKLLPIFYLAAFGAATAAPVSCPPQMTSPSGSLPKLLSSVRVLSYAAGKPSAKGEALPIHAPDAEFRVKRMVRQTWRVNGDAPHYKYELHCIYGGNDQFISVQIPAAVKLCTATDDLHASKFAMTCR